MTNNLFELIFRFTEDKGRLGDEDCKRFRSQYDPSAYSAAAMWSSKWGSMGSIPHIKEEKNLTSSNTAGDLSGGHPQSPVTATVSPTNGDSSPYGGNFPGSGSGVPFTNTNSNTTQSNNDILYETMSQVYPALSSSLGKGSKKIIFE